MGITYLTNSMSAKERWAESHFLRTSVISNVFNQLGMSKKEDILSDLKTYKVKNDNSAFQRIRIMIRLH